MFTPFSHCGAMPRRRAELRSRRAPATRLNNIQYRSAKFVTGALPYSSETKLNEELGWEKLSERSEILSLSLFHKIHTYQTRPFLRKCMPEIVHSNINTRSTKIFKPYKETNCKFFPPLLQKIHCIR